MARKNSRRIRSRGSLGCSTVLAAAAVLALIGISMLEGSRRLSMRSDKWNLAGSYLSSLLTNGNFSYDESSEMNEEALQIPSNAWIGHGFEEDEESDEAIREKLVDTLSSAPVSVKWKSAFDSEADLGVRVPGKTGKLSQDKVRKYLEPLVKVYLEPFKAGIWRRALSEVLNRDSKASIPENATEGLSTLLFQIKSNRVHMFDAHGVLHNVEKPFYKHRVSQLVWLLSKMVKEKRIPDTEFLVSVHDCVQTVSFDHTYRLPKYVESKPVFTIVGCNVSDNIPIPLWRGNEMTGGTFENWADSMSVYSTDPIDWHSKTQKALFRGSERLSNFYETKELATENCDKVGRGKLYLTSKKYPDLFDVGVSGSCGPYAFEEKKMKVEEQHGYKYNILCEGNCFWSDRSTMYMFGPSAIIKQDSPCGMYFEPLLTPWHHYVPTDYFFNDIMKRVTWLQANDRKAREIVRNANEFAWNFLTIDSISLYFEILLRQYTSLLIDKNIVLEANAIDVTEAKF